MVADNVFHEMIWPLSLHYARNLDVDIISNAAFNYELNGD